MSVELLVLLLTPLFLFIVYIKQIYTYWARRNVPFIEPRFPFGNFKELRKKAMADISIEFYRRMKSVGPFYGAFFFWQPLITVTDLDLIKTIMIKDFNYFPDRGFYHNPRDDPLSAHLFAIEGKRWRSLRQRLTPVFTSSKLKMMFPTLTAVGDNFAEYLAKTVGNGSELELKDCMVRFTTDVIGSCAFGIECNTFNEPNSEFRQFGKKVFETPRHSPLMRFLLLLLYPEFAKAMRMKMLDSSAAEFFSALVKKTVSYREKNSIDRNDFLNQLIEIKKSGIELSIEEMAAQSFIFFAAGFETSSSNQTFCLYELARNPDCQEKARQCVLDAIQKHGGLTYEAASDMQYLDQCINEILRMYPSLPILERKAFQDYKIPDTDVVIPKGMRVHIPAFAIHRDEKYYPNPEKFDPSRFSPEEVEKRHPCAFLPFGEGPRNCIGLRFGMMQSRVGLATILSKYRFSVCSKTAIPLEYSNKASILQPKEALWLRVDPL